MGLIAKTPRAHRVDRDDGQPGPMVADDNEFIHGVDEESQRSLCGRNASAWFELATVTWSPDLVRVCRDCRASTPPTPHPRD
jgi:hypothetical protein